MSMVSPAEIFLLFFTFVAVYQNPAQLNMFLCQRTGLEKRAAHSHLSKRMDELS